MPHPAELVALMPRDLCSSATPAGWCSSTIGRWSVQLSFGVSCRLHDDPQYVRRCSRLPTFWPSSRRLLLAQEFLWILNVGSRLDVCYEFPSPRLLRCAHPYLALRSIFFVELTTVAMMMHVHAHIYQKRLTFVSFFCGCGTKWL